MAICGRYLEWRHKISPKFVQLKCAICTVAELGACQDHPWNRWEKLRGRGKMKPLCQGYCSVTWLWISTRKDVLLLLWWHWTVLINQTWGNWPVGLKGCLQDVLVSHGHMVNPDSISLASGLNVTLRRLGEDCLRMVLGTIWKQSNRYCWLHSGPVLCYKKCPKLY